MTYEELRSSFNKVFGNLPIPERSNAIYIDQKYGPMSWNVVRLETMAGTDLGLTALTTMHAMAVI